MLREGVFVWILLEADPELRIPSLSPYFGHRRKYIEGGEAIQGKEGSHLEALFFSIKVKLAFNIILVSGI